MENDDVLTLMPVEHPNPCVQRAGFDLTDPYVEQCWGPVIGPSATALVRRLPTLWAEQMPATMAYGELGRSLGLGSGGGGRSRLLNTIHRLPRFGLGAFDEGDRVLAVYLRMPGLGPKQLARVPAWTRQAHERLLGVHLRQLVAVAEAPFRPPTVTERLDHLQRRRTVTAQNPVPPSRALGR